MRSKIPILLLVAVLLAACGNKGGLYLPDEPPPDSSRQNKRS
ncbi:MAG: LPS translocon maturation chaperone LptM [Burkholderiales bacterium]